MKLALKFKDSIAIDCHSHMYTPKYMEIMRKRSVNPRVIVSNNENRLLILPGEEFDPTTSAGIFSTCFWRKKLICFVSREENRKGGELRQ